MTDYRFGLLRLPGQVSFGAGSIESLPVSVSRLGKRVFVCADPYIATTEHFRIAVSAMAGAGLTVTTYSGIVPELPVDSVLAAAEVAREFRPDVVVGYGGGSAIDLSKLVALLVRQAGPLSRYYGEHNVGEDVVPLVAVPTTAGTGSEVTPVAVVSDPERELKVGVSSPYLIPLVAIVDPRLTLGAPADLTAHSGIDALVHAIESFTAATRSPQWAEKPPVFVGRNRLTSLLALEAVASIGGSLRTAVNDPHDLPAREAMAYGSLLAGMAFGSAGTHLSHALQYPIGALSKTPHGLGTGLMLPYVMQALLPEAVPRLAEVARALGGGDAADDVLARQAIEAVRGLTMDIGIPSTLAEIGITADQLPRIARLSLTVSRLANNSPLVPTFELFMSILEAAFSGDRSEDRREHAIRTVMK